MKDSNLEDRIQREKDWHDSRFNEDTRHQKTGRFYHALEDWYSDYNLMCLKSGAKEALEIGAGLETISHQEVLFNLISIDISETAIRKLNNLINKEKVKFEVADAHNLPFSNERFDLVFARGVLHHLELSSSIDEISRVLTFDGQVVFGEPLRGNPLIRLFRFLTPHLRTPDEQPLSRADINFIKSKFGNVSVKYYGFLTLFFAILFGKSNDAVKKIDNFLLNKLRLGSLLGWACLIHNSQPHELS